jgi:hypothetical protein
MMDRAPADTHPGSGFPPIDVPRQGPLEILVTDGPVTEYDNRRVLDRTRCELTRIDAWSRHKLTGEKPEHQFYVGMRNAGWFTELELQVVLHGHIRNSLVTRTRSDLKVKRLWLSRAYIHGDLGRACFAMGTQMAATTQPPQGQVWFATLNDGEREIVGESRRSYRYGESASGKVQLSLHDDHSYVLEWSSHDDGVGRDYRTSWFRGDELLSETRESVFAMEEAVAAGCFASRVGSYCDTDSI